MSHRQGHLLTDVHGPKHRWNGNAALCFAEEVEADVETVLQTEHFEQKFDERLDRTRIHRRGDCASAVMYH